MRQRPSRHLSVRCQRQRQCRSWCHSCCPSWQFRRSAVPSVLLSRPLLLLLHTPFAARCSCSTLLCSALLCCPALALCCFSPTPIGPPSAATSLSSIPPSPPIATLEPAFLPFPCLHTVICISNFGLASRAWAVPDLYDLVLAASCGSSLRRGNHLPAPPLHRLQASPSASYTI